MSKVAVVFWSGTGNTEAMANAVEKGAKAAGADVTVFRTEGFGPSNAGEFDAVAFGCPAMGAEVLEEAEFEPMFASVENSLGGKKVALFGSWGWGGGAWMQSWEDRCKGDGINLVTDSVMCENAPDDDALAACEALGKALA
ncbi:MAG: flavodoxin [Lachnospiraceae bacterium]|nr:flavodoxin [Lachnospiraceae bacterium]